METELTSVLSNAGYSYISINNFSSIELVLNLFKNNDLAIETEHNNDPVLLNYIGNYYEYNDDYKNMIKWYNLAAEKGSSIAKSNLKTCKSEEEMCLSIILKKHNYSFVKLKNKDDITDVLALFTADFIPEHNNDDVVLNYIGNYYEIKKDENNAIKYYKLAAIKNNNSAIHNLQKIYEKKLNNKDLLDKEVTYENYYNFLISINRIYDILHDKDKRLNYVKFMKDRKNNKVYENNCPNCINDLDNSSDNCVLVCGHRYCNECFNLLCDIKQKECFVCKKCFC